MRNELLTLAPPTSLSAIPIDVASGGLPLAESQKPIDTHVPDALGNNLAPPTKRLAMPKLDSSGGQLTEDQDAAEWAAADALLYVLAASLDDLEGVRKATANRLGALTREPEDGGQGLPADADAVVRLAALLDGIDDLEAQSVKALQRAMKAHPLGPWVARTRGVGLKQAARLLAAIGNPYVIADAEYEDGTRRESRPRRGPAELWAYCGYAPGQQRRKGVKANWNAEAKMRAFLIAEKQVQTRGKFRPVYDAAKVNWAMKDTTDGHRHNHALRVTAKAILKDLFLEARSLQTHLAGEPRLERYPDWPRSPATHFPPTTAEAMPKILASGG